MEMNGFMGGLYRITEWIMRFSVTNVLWVLCSAPFFFFGVNLLVAENTEQLKSVIYLMAAVAPFTLFPATTAMFTVVRKWIMGQEDAPLLRTFFRGFKDNYVQSLLGGLLYTILYAVMIMNFQFYSGQSNLSGILAIMFLVFMVVLSISAFHFFSLTAHMYMSTIQIIKNSVLITIGRPITSIMIALSAGVVLYISFYQFPFLIPFFMGSLIAYMSFWHFYRVYQKALDIQKQKEESEAGADEEEPDMLDRAEADLTDETARK